MQRDIFYTQTVVTVKFCINIFTETEGEGTIDLFLEKEFWLFILYL